MKWNETRQKSLERQYLTSETTANTYSIQLHIDGQDKTNILFYLFHCETKENSLFYRTFQQDKKWNFIFY
jgi:hypothetical protein